MRDMSTTVLGQRLPYPIAIAPTAMQRMAHPDGEVATARGTIKLHSKATQNFHNLNKNYHDDDDEKKHV